MLRIVSSNPRIPIGTPTGAPTTVIVSATPTAINASPTIASTTRPVTAKTIASSLHTALNGHNNHFISFFLTNDEILIQLPGYFGNNFLHL